MNRSLLRALPLAVVTVIAASSVAAPPPKYDFKWWTVVNNGDDVPGTTRKFNSYNQPSVNANQLVVFRARSRGGQGGGQPEHGVYARNMAGGSAAVKILDRNRPVPAPNNRGSKFIEPPSFPRIDISSDTVATRGNHQPVWKVTNENGETIEQLGTTGIYTNPSGTLITGASKLGSVDEFSYFEVPEAPGTPFDVFPGAPAVTDRSTIVFKGNYTVGSGKTGVYYRDLTGNESPVVLIANNSETTIPGSATVFGSTSPPSAANGKAVFAGFDNEENPTKGGIYLAPLSGTKPPLTTLVSIGGQVPGESSSAKFNRLGEGVSFDGRFVAFWGAWGTETKTLHLQCRNEGNAARVQYCLDYYNRYEVQVPVKQGIFVHDTKTGQTHTVAKAPVDFADFLFWNFSGRTPGTGEGDDDGEFARWRSSAFAAVSGLVHGNLADVTFHAAFKARTGEVVDGSYPAPIDGIYLTKAPGQSEIYGLVETGMDGTLLDTEAVDGLGNPLPVTEMGIERDGFRGSSIVINASMGSEETGWAGIYLTELKKPKK
jgi:hypothetical protein